MNSFSGNFSGVADNDRFSFGIKKETAAVE